MNKQKGIVVFGAGGHGKVVSDILAESDADILGFIDEDKAKIGTKVNGFRVMGDWSYLKNKDSAALALGIGNNATREKVFRKAKEMGLAIVSAIHPKAVVSRDISIGEGVVVMPGAVINAGTVLEEGAVVNTGATIDHDCYLERFCQVWPGAHLAGTVRVGEFSYVGTGTSVIPNINIGKKVMIGAGAVIIADIPDNVTVAGNPARII